MMSNPEYTKMRVTYDRAWGRDLFHGGIMRPIPFPTASRIRRMLQRRQRKFYQEVNAQPAL